MGVKVTRDLELEYKDRDDVSVVDLLRLRKEARSLNKLGRKAKK